MYDVDMSKKAYNLSLDPHIVDEAKALATMDGDSLSGLVEKALLDKLISHERTLHRARAAKNGGRDADLVLRDAQELERMAIDMDRAANNTNERAAAQLLHTEAERLAGGHQVLKAHAQEVA